jgi:hypothetical protein
MHICYLDESGTPDKSDQSKHFVYAGIAIPESSWKSKDNEISAIKQKYGLSGEEIHTAWILRKYLEQVKIPNFESLTWEQRKEESKKFRLQRLSEFEVYAPSKKKSHIKEYKETLNYVHLSLLERQNLIFDLCDLMSSWNDSRIFFSAIKKQNYDTDYTIAGGIYEDAFCQVVTRFQKYLENISTNNAIEYGIIVADNNVTINKKLTSLARSFHKIGTFWREIPNIIETPLFVDSSQTAMVQISDIVSYAIRRFFDNGESLLFDKISPRFDRNKKVVVGGQHFTPLETCPCSFCVTKRNAK